MAEDVLEVEVDGLSVLWVPSDSRDLTGGIIVRVGLSDEPFVRRGFTHLIEHLALSTLNVDYEYNGFVDATTTNFVAKGSADDVVHFVESMFAALADLPYERLDVERRVLVAESERNGVSAVASALAILYGANGVGSMALPEMGLWQATPSDLERWLEQWFTRQNMVLWFAGPEPLRPSLDGLRHGRRRPTVQMERRPLTAPGYFLDPVPGPGMVNVVEPSPLVAAGLAVLNDRLTDRLRMTEGMSYSVNSNLQPLGAAATLLTLAADCRADDVGDVFSIMVMEVNRFSFEGPTDQEIDDHVRRRRRLIEDNDTAVARASTEAYHRLQEAPCVDPAEALSVVEAARPAAVAAAMHAVSRSAIWVLPPGSSVRDQRFIAATTYAKRDLSGPAFRSRAGDTELVIDAGAVGIDRGNGLAIVVPVNELVGAVAFQHGAHTFFRRDAVSLTIQPADYPGCEQAYRRFLTRVPSAMTVEVPRSLHADVDTADIEDHRHARQPAGTAVAAIGGRFRPVGR